MLESLSPSPLPHRFSASNLDTLQSCLLCKKSSIDPSIEKFRLCCVLSTTRRFCRSPAPSRKWSSLMFRGFRGVMSPVMSRSSSKMLKDCKGHLLCQSVLDDKDEEEERDYAEVTAPAATDGRIDIVINKLVIQQLDLSPAQAVLSGYVKEPGDTTLKDPKELLHRTVGFVIDYQWDDPYDMRELSEMPDVRLWFVRLDAMYPWLPVVLDWRAGELARYAAMLVPHQMKKKEGLVFNPEALELFVMNKLFTVYPWLQSIKVVKADAKVNDMLKVLGYNIEAELFQLIESA